MVTDAHVCATTWLSQLSEAFSSPDPAQTFAELLEPEAHVRDYLIFSWNLRTLSGQGAVASYIGDALNGKVSSVSKDGLSDFKLDERLHFAPAVLQVEQPGAVELNFTFKTAVAAGRGTARLFSQADLPWLAGSVCFMLDAFIGHEESGPQAGIFGVTMPVWEEARKEARSKAEEDPYVLIVGAGQSGLNVAARLQQLGIKALIVEKNARVGDTWRRRYRSLTLHTPKEHHPLLYAPFPDNWPVFTPKEKLADWMEAYATSQELNIWLSTTLLPTPTYDETTKRWTVTVERSGETITLHPAHIVLAMGTLGSKRVPEVPGIEEYTGATMHASAFTSTQELGWEGKRVVMVGAGNTACGVTVDLSSSKCTVTMLQRSPTFTVFPDTLAAYWSYIAPPGLPTPIVDYKALSVPWLTRGEVIKGMRAMAEQYGVDPDASTEGDMRRKQALLAIGYRTIPDDHGLQGPFYKTLGSYLIDHGLSDVVIKYGNISVKPGTVERFTTSGVELSDGSTVEADVVIFATGYVDRLVGFKQLFGEEVIDRCGKFWSMDEEGELCGAYRQLGQPGLYYAMGDFHHSRALSKQLGLLIQAHYLGFRE